MYRRRAFLATCGAVVGSTALGGCGRLGDTETGLTEYSDWLPAETDSVEGFAFARPAGFTDLRGPPPGHRLPSDVGVEPEEIDTYLSDSEVLAVEPSLDPGALVERTRQAGDRELRHEGERDGYDRYVADDGTQLAIDDSVAVYGESRNVQAVLDARHGGADRLVDDSQSARLLAEALGAGDLVWGAVKLVPGETSLRFPEGQRASGERVDVEAEELLRRRVAVFEDEDETDTSILRRYLPENATDVSSSQDGRVATVRFTDPTIRDR